MAVAAHAPREGADDARPLLAGRRALALTLRSPRSLIAASVTPPWLAEREQRRATELAAVNPAAAVDRLDRAADLNPLSPVPDKAAGIVEIRAASYAAAERSLRQAFERDGGDSGLTCCSACSRPPDGRDREALRLVREAAQLAPRDDVTLRRCPTCATASGSTRARSTSGSARTCRARIGPD